MTTRPLRLAALALAVAGAGATAHASAPKGIDIGTPEGAIAAFRRIQCSTEDSRPTVYYWTGETYSRVPGEPDRLLFRFEGMNVRQCVTVTDPVRGRGFRQVSREVLFYLDPATADGRPYRSDIEVMGDHWWSTTTVPLFYRNPLAGDYQDYVGGTYHATEMFNFFGRISDLTDPRKHSADVNVAWARISDWLPWMKMRSLRPGGAAETDHPVRATGFFALHQRFRLQRPVSMSTLHAVEVPVTGTRHGSNRRLPRG